MPADVLGIRIQNGYGVSGWVASTKRPMVNSEAALDLGAAAADFLSCLSVPLQAGDTLLGVITLYSEKAAAYDEQHLRLLQAVAPHVADSLAAALQRRSRATATRPDARANSEGLRLVSRR